jgi:hypothetical protein
METPSSPIEAPTKAHSKARSLADILDQLGPITNVLYTPFQPEQPTQSARALLPPSFTQNPYPFDYFSLFFTPSLFQTITSNTNQYASTQRGVFGPIEERTRDWTELLQEELCVYWYYYIYGSSSRVSY